MLRKGAENEKKRGAKPMRLSVSGSAVCLVLEVAVVGSAVDLADTGRCEVLDEVNREVREVEVVQACVRKAVQLIRSGAVEAVQNLYGCGVVRNALTSRRIEEDQIVGLGGIEGAVLSRDYDISVVERYVAGTGEGPHRQEIAEYPARAHIVKLGVVFAGEL